MSGRPARSPLWIVIGGSAWMALACNAALWLELHRLGLLHGARGWGLAAALALMIGAACAALLALLAWRWTLKPAATLLILVAALTTHFMLSYGVVIDPTMIDNALQTDAREAGALFNGRLVVTLLALALPPLALMWMQPLAYGSWRRQLQRSGAVVAASLLLIVAAAFASFQPLASATRNHKQLRYLVAPLNTVYSLTRVALRPWQRDDSTLAAVGLDARLGLGHAGRARPPLLLLVLGETARSANFGLNGYARDTTPALSREPVVSFRNAWSCGTSTAASVPCMFSHLGRDGFEQRKTNVESLLDVVQRAGLAVLWIDNQSGCKGVCDRVPNVSTARDADPALCAGGGCLDEVMLKGLDARIAALPAERRARGVVVVMHPMGSHGPAYHLRSPPSLKRFLPECVSSSLQDCSRDAVVNAYDNSIAYADHFLARAIGWLRTQQPWADAAMVYVSDHGESLGENNLYLHGLPYAVAPDVQKHVPWITWASDGYLGATHLSLACLRGRQAQPLSHDHYFHSVLGLLDVSTSVYRAELDAYAPCRDRAPSPPRGLSSP